MTLKKNLKKGKEKVTSTHPLHSHPQPQLFESIQQNERYIKKFEIREVLLARYLDDSFLEAIDFPYIATFKEFG